MLSHYYKTSIGKGVVITLLIFGIGILVWQNIRRLARYNEVRANVAALAFYVEDYRQTKGSYPKSIEELTSRVDPSLASILRRKLQDRFHDIYYYTVRSNGFDFKVIAPETFFSKNEAIEERFPSSEGVGRYYWVVTNDTAK